MVYRDADIVRGTGSFVTLRRYISVIEAEFDRAALQAAGLDVRLLDVGTAAIIPHGDTSLGVRLQVRESEVDRAGELLEAPDPLDESERAAHPELQRAKGEARWRRQVDADADARRAFRAAVIGLFLFPPLGQLYSAWLLLTLYPRRHALSRAGQWNAGGAAAIIVAIAAFVLVLFAG